MEEDQTCPASLPELKAEGAAPCRSPKPAEDPMGCARRSPAPRSPARLLRGSVPCQEHKSDVWLGWGGPPVGSRGSAGNPFLSKLLLRGAWVRLGPVLLPDLVNGLCLKDCVCSHTSEAVFACQRPLKDFHQDSFAKLIR